MNEIELSPESSTKCDGFTGDANLINRGTLSEVLEQSFPNLQRLSDQERSEVMRILVDKFSAKTVPLPERPAPRSKASNDGSEPLAHPGQEATAKFFTSLKHEQEFKNVSELAKSSGVTRKTIYLWRKNPRVLQRMHYFTSHRKDQGDLIGRLGWTRCMVGMVEKAASGDVAAAKFVADRAWPQQTQTGKPSDDLLAPYRTAKESDDAL